MSDGSLSQDEIDALLQGTDTIDMNGDAGGAESALSESDKEAFRSLLSTVIETQGSNMSMLTNTTITFGKPVVKIASKEEIVRELPEEIVETRMDFKDGMRGEHAMIMDQNTAIKIASLMVGQDGLELNDMALTTISEAVSNIVNPAITAIGNKTDTTITTTPPTSDSLKASKIILPRGESPVLVEYPVSIRGQSVKLYEIYSVELVKNICSSLSRFETGSNMGTGQATTSKSVKESVKSMSSVASGGGKSGNMDESFENFISGKQSGTPNVQQVQFPNLQAGPTGSHEQGNIGLLMDVYMELTVELGRTKKLIRDILGIGEGTIIELDKLAGEPVDILVNHKLIAKGEVVVIDENFGVRVTEIVSPLERMGDFT
jgi:flagellar motor switch protein FliN/FliY